jgi:hypothetical protein
MHLCEIEVYRSRHVPYILLRKWRRVAISLSYEYFPCAKISGIKAMKHEQYGEAIENEARSGGIKVIGRGRKNA